MAKSGQVNTNTTYDSYFWVKWEQVGDQDITNNRTLINWYCGVHCGHSFYSNAIKMSAVTINGTQIYGGGTYSNLAHGDFTLASGSMWIGHNSDGTKTFSISPFTGWLYSNYNYASNGESYTLTQIPRNATMTGASDFTDQENPWITFDNPAGYPIDHVWLEPYPPNPTKHLCQRYSIPNTGRYTWSLKDYEINVLRNHCTGPSCPIRLGMYYKVGSETKATYLDKTFTVVESDLTRPEVDVSVTLDNGSLLSKFDGLWIQGKSRAKVKLSATGQYGADIKSYSAQVDGKTYNSQEFTSDVLQSAGNVKITGYAKDSRNITGSAEQTVNVREYAKPLVIPLGSENAVLCYRSDGNGKRVGNSESVWVKAARSYYRLEGNNTCALRYRVKPANDAWDDSTHKWADLIPGSGTVNSYDALIPSKVFALTESYTVQIMAIDDIGESDIKTFEIPTQDVALHLGKGGKKVAVGTYCTDLDDYTFYSEWKAIFDKEVVIGGYPVADHIVEAGTSGDWTYVKMASGVAECWAKISYTVDLVAENSRAYVYLNRTFPIAFKDLPFCNVTLANQTTWNQVLSSADFTESLFKSFTVYRMGAGVNVTAGGTADIRVIGYWK